MAEDGPDPPGDGPTTDEEALATQESAAVAVPLDVRPGTALQRALLAHQGGGNPIPHVIDAMGRIPDPGMRDAALILCEPALWVRLPQATRALTEALGYLVAGGPRPAHELLAHDALEAAVRSFVASYYSPPSEAQPYWHDRMEGRWEAIYESLRVLGEIHPERPPGWWGALVAASGLVETITEDAWLAQYGMGHTWIREYGATSGVFQRLRCTACDRAIAWYERAVGWYPCPMAAREEGDGR